MMKQYVLRLDENNLHNDLTAIRIARGTKGPNGKQNHPCTVGIDEEWEIDLKWRDGNDIEHTLPVYVKGPALEVKGFKPKEGDRIDFGGDFNYAGETGTQLTYWNITGEALVNLEEGKYDLSERGYKFARLCYVMCVFVASEIVRNEVLEIMFVYGNFGMWENYKRLYRNWAKVSSIINGCKSNRFAEIIYVDKLKEKLSSWMTECPGTVHQDNESPDDENPETVYTDDDSQNNERPDDENHDNEIPSDAKRKVVEIYESFAGVLNSI